MQISGFNEPKIYKMVKSIITYKLKGFYVVIPSVIYNDWIFIYSLALYFKEVDVKSNKQVYNILLFEKCHL